MGNEGARSVAAHRGAGHHPQKQQNESPSGRIREEALDRSLSCAQGVAYRPQTAGVLWAQLRLDAGHGGCIPFSLPAGSPLSRRLLAQARAGTHTVTHTCVHTHVRAHTHRHSECGTQVPYRHSWDS